MSHTGFAALGAFQLNRTSPFQCSPTELAESSLEEAHALTLMLGLAFNEASDDPEEALPLRPVHVARALDGIRTLISLAAWAGEAERKGG